MAGLVPLAGAQKASRAPQGNPAVSADGVWWDSEDGAFGLFYAVGSASGGGLGPAVTVALRLPHFAALSQSRQHSHAPI